MKLLFGPRPPLYSIDIAILIFLYIQLSPGKSSLSCKGLFRCDWKDSFQQSLGASTRLGVVSSHIGLARIFSRWEIFHQKSQYIQTGLDTSYCLPSSQSSSLRRGNSALLHYIPLWLARSTRKQFHTALAGMLLLVGRAEIMQLTSGFPQLDPVINESELQDGIADQSKSFVSLLLLIVYWGLNISPCCYKSFLQQFRIIKLVLDKSLYNLLALYCNKDRRQLGRYNKQFLKINQLALYFGNYINIVGYS